MKRSCRPRTTFIRTVTPLLAFLGACFGQRFGSAIVWADAPVETTANKLPPDHALVPDDAQLFIYLHVGKYWNGGESASLRKISQAHPVVLTYETMNLANLIGVGVDEIDRVAVFGALDSPLVAITSLKPFDRPKIIAALVPGAPEQKINGKSYLSAKETAVAYIDDRTFLTGNAACVKRLLEGPATGGQPGTMKCGIEAAAKEPLLVFAIVPNPLNKLVETKSEKSQVYLPLFKAISWRLTFDAEEDLHVRFWADFQDEETATKSLPGVAKAGEVLQQYLNFAGSEMPKFLEREVKDHPHAGDIAAPLTAALTAAQAGLKAMTVKQRGKVVEASVLIKTSEPAMTAVMLATMIPRAAKK